MKRFHTLRIRAGWWVDNGGGATLISCGQKEGEVVDVNVAPEQHLRWLEELPLMHIDKHRVYVHAGVDPAFSASSRLFDLKSEATTFTRRISARLFADVMCVCYAIKTDEVRYTHLPAGVTNASPR